MAEPYEAIFYVNNLVGAPQSGTFKIKVHPEWAPHGAARFTELVKARYFDGCRFFRAIRDFIVQWGIAADPSATIRWMGRPIRDDTVKTTNSKGRVSFAAAGPQSRTAQVFVNINDNLVLDMKQFAPFAEVTEGFDIVERMYTGYGEGAPNGIGPSQSRIITQGNVYLDMSYPKLSSIDRVEFAANVSEDHLSQVIAFGTPPAWDLLWWLGVWPTIFLSMAFIFCCSVLGLLYTLGIFSRHGKAKSRTGGFREIRTEEDTELAVPPEAVGARSRNGMAADED